MTRKYKKQWTDPKLIVLSRSRPEEVLTNDCKHPTIPVGAAGYNNECQLLDSSSSCKVCHSQNNKS